MATALHRDDMQFMIATAIMGFVRSASILKDNPTEQNAERACLDNRWAFALLLPGLPEFLRDHRDFVQTFAHALADTCNVTRSIAPQTNELRHYAKNMGDRLERVEMVLRGAKEEDLMQHITESLENAAII